MPIDPRFQRIARRLSTFELVAGDDDLTGDDLGLAPGNEGGRKTDRFLGFYSREGLRRALEAYGVHRKLEAQGLGDYEVVVECRSSHQHRAQLVLDGVVDDDHRLVDLVMRMQRVRLPVQGEEGQADEVFSVLAVEWLSLQNPRGQFGPGRPRLPGQGWPGLGLGYDMHNLTQLMAQRLERDGVVSVPEQYHLTLVYRRAGYRFTSVRHRLAVEALERASAGLSLAAVAWAVERGFVEVVEGDGERAVRRRWTYEPGEMVAPVSPRLQAALERWPAAAEPPCGDPDPGRLEVDVEGLRRSLVEDLVEGLDPEDLHGG